jgi:hypothetical protein
MKISELENLGVMYKLEEVFQFLYQLLENNKIKVENELCTQSQINSLIFEVIETLETDDKGCRWDFNNPVNREYFRQKFIDEHKQLYHLDNHFSIKSN